MKCNGNCIKCPYCIKWGIGWYECYATFIVYPIMSLEMVWKKE